MLKVDVIGVETVGANLRKFSEDVQRMVQEQMEASASKVVADAQNILESNGSSVNGFLKSSGRVVAGKGYARVIFGKSIKKYGKPYAYWVEFGRKPGRKPPIAPILDWVKKKGLAGTYSIKTKKRSGNKAARDSQDKSVAYAIRNSIGAKGTRPHPFLRPAFERERVKFKEAMKRIIK